MKAQDTPLEDEDLITPEHILHGVTEVFPMPSRAGLAHAIADGLIESFSDPAYRVQFFAGVIATVPCTRARLGFIPSVLISLAVGAAARWGYESVQDIRAKLDGPDAPGDV